MIYQYSCIYVNKGSIINKKKVIYLVVVDPWVCVLEGVRCRGDFAMQYMSQVSKVIHISLCIGILYLVFVDQGDAVKEQARCATQCHKNLEAQNDQVCLCDYHTA